MGADPFAHNPLEVWIERYLQRWWVWFILPTVSNKFWNNCLNVKYKQILKFYNNLNACYITNDDIIRNDAVKDGLQLSHSGILLFILRDVTLLLLWN